MPEIKKATLGKLPTECLQRISRHLWSASPTTSLRHPENPKAFQASQLDILHLALASQQLHACIIPELYAFPAIQSIRQAGLLLRTLMRHPHLGNCIKSFRLGIDHWSPRSRPISSQHGSLHDATVGWATTLHPRRGQAWWPEDSVVNVTAQLLQKLSVHLQIMVVDSHWIHFMEYFSRLRSALCRLRPTELYFVNPPGLPSQRAVDGRVNASSAAEPWLLENEKLRVLDLGNIEHFPCSSPALEDNSREIEELRFEVHEGASSQSDPIVNVASLFKPTKVVCKQVRLNSVLVDPDTLLDHFPDARVLDLSVEPADEDSEGSWAQPIDVDYEVFWRPCRTDLNRNVQELSVKVCKLGDPSAFLQYLPPSVHTLALGLTTLDPTTLLLPIITALQSSSPLSALKKLRLDLSSSPFEAARTRAYDPVSQRLKLVNEYVDMWDIFEPEARRLAGDQGVKLEVVPGPHNEAFLHR